MGQQTSSCSSSCSFSSSSSSFSYAWKYHVFLSFRGPDTRHGFIGHLHKALCDKGIRTFIDDEELQRGEEITPSLAKAIEESRIAIPVFSKSYASSTFCLNELVKIMECVKGKGRLVLPVFYDVDPREVRRQSGCYEKAFTEHEERFKDDKMKVRRWREALHQAANLSGEHFNLGNEYECDFIAKIVKEISKRIIRVPLHVADYPVGLESRVLEVIRLLNDGSECGVHMVGIYGIGGIGKTTLAKAVYNSVADQFESLCFIENMSELSDQRGLVYLQEMVLSKILGDKVCNLGSVSEGIPIIKERLRSKKVLLGLDNVDKHDQLQAIIGSLGGLGSESRVIITTRDKHLLTTHGVNKAYEVRDLNEKEAVELFSWKAFKSEKVETCYMDIFKKLVEYASGLPLALELIGSSLFGKCVEEWISTLDVYRKIPHGDMQKKLKVSFDALHDQEQNIFLDIACCFKGYKLAEVKRILHAHYDVDPTYSIGVLVDKSLIKTNDWFHHDVVILHDLIQDMGREIVRLESPEEPGARSRLWLAKDIIEILQGDNGTSKIRLINLGCDYNDDIIEWDGQAFRKMKELRTLVIGKCRFSQGPKYLPSSLRVLKWETHPLQEYQPFYFDSTHLAVLDLSGSCFDSIQLTYLLKKKFENMSVLKFDGCGRITKIPNLSSAPKLEVLSFAGCDNLTEIDESVGSLGELKTLDASGCRQLRSLPPLMLPSLEQLQLDGCQSLESFPEILGKMEKMRWLWLRGVGIKKLPYSIHNLTGLQLLWIDAGEIVELPSSITFPEKAGLWFRRCKGLLLPNEDEGEEQVSSMSFSNKINLYINDCNVSEEFFRTALPTYPCLQSLTLTKGNFRIVPECIREFRFLRSLKLTDCEKLEEIQGIPPNIEELCVVNCTSLSALTREMLLNKKLHEEGQDKMFILPEPAERLPEWFEYRRRELSIAFWFRNKFPTISFGLFTRSSHLDQRTIHPRLTINGVKSFQLVANDFDYSYLLQGVGHILIFSKTQTTFRDQVGEALSKDEWKRAVISVYDDEPFDRKELDCVEVGIHIIKEKSYMDDIRLPEPLSQNQCDTLRDLARTQLVWQQTYPDPFLAHRRHTQRPYPFLAHRRHTQRPYLDSKKMRSDATTTALNVQEHLIGLESRVSFDALEEVHQQIFLDIVCCFRGCKLKAVEEMLHAHYGASVEQCVNILVEKSLIKIKKDYNDDDYINLHDLIQDMGREIICLESPNVLGARSRLWLAEEIIEVLQQDEGSSKIQVINLESGNNGDVIEWDGLAFKKMENLRTLIIEKHQFSQFPKYLPSSLKVLEWEINPSQEILPFDFDPKQLVIFDLSINCFDSVQLAELLKRKFENMRVLKFDYCENITKIPNLSSAPRLEVLSFIRCYELTEIDESVGSLDKLKILDAFGCHKLRSLRALMLPSLERLELDGCLSLESFPEILGKMECMTCLCLSSRHIKKLPYSIHNLTRLQSLSLAKCGAVELPSGIMLPGVETLSFDHCEGLLLPIQDEGEEQVSSMPFSSTTHLVIRKCKISSEFLRIALPLFPRLQSLRLTRENFRILPECIREFQFLRLLDLTDCKKLEEIRGIPPNIEELCACSCRSLSSLTTGMLLSKKLYEKGQDKTFILPGKSLPVWFEHQRRESSITFWFRNKFPAISFGVLSPSAAFKCYFRAKLTINGTKSFPLVQYRPHKHKVHYHPYKEGRDHDLIFIFSKTHTAFRDQVDEALSENELNYAVFSVSYYWGEELYLRKDVGCTVGVGVHISEERSSMADVSFTYPVPSTLTTLNVQGSDVDSRMYDKEWLSLRPCWQEPEPLDRGNLESNLMQSASTSHNIMVQDRAVLNPVESSQAPSYVQTQNIQVPWPTSSGAIVCGEEPHLGTCCTVLPTTTEESLRNQVEQSQEDVEMEYSLDAGGTHILSHSHDHSSTTATSEDFKDALILVEEFTTNVPFTYPDPLKNTEDNGLCEVQQLLLLKSNIPTTCEPMECTEEEEDWLSLPPSLDDVYCSSDSEPQSLVASPVEEEPLKDAYNNSLLRKCLVLFLCLLLTVVTLFASAMWHWCFHHNDILSGTSLQEHQRLTSINQQNLEGYESVNKAKGKGMVELTCNDKAAEDDGKKPITENLPKTKAVSGSYESSFHSENVDQLVNSLMEIQAPSPQPLDPLAELERILLGSYDLHPESTSPTSASSSDIQASEVVIMLQNLEPLLDNPLESLIADGEIKHQMLDCLSKLGQLEDRIPIPLQSIVAQVGDFYEDLIHNFPSIQQTLVDYSCLEETRSKFLDNLNQAKAKQAQIDAEVLRGKVQVEELDTEIADLEIKLKAAVEKRNELKLAIKNGEAEKNKLLKDASAWLMESKQVVKKIRSSEYAYRDAQNSKARLERRLAMLKGAFAANNRKP